MDGLNQILGSSGMDVSSLAARFGISPEQANAALGSLMPAVAGGMQKRQKQGTLGPVTDAGASIDQPDTSVGNEILGHLFGSKDVSRQVADHAAGQSGVSSTVLQACCHSSLRWWPSISHNRAAQAKPDRRPMGWAACSARSLVARVAAWAVSPACLAAAIR
jgi:hypothetical protein